MVLTPEEIYQAVDLHFKKKGLSQDSALTFDDVALLDLYSRIPSRSDIKNTTGRLAKNIFLNTPIISANMDTITESRMAIAMARLGGLGFIHQFLPIENKKKEVELVKRADSAIIERPLVVPPDTTLKEARKLMASYGISSLLVVDENTEVLIGILSHRDYQFEKEEDKKVGDLMTKKPGLITARWGSNLKMAQELLLQHKIEKLPLLDKKGRVRGLITTKDLEKTIKYPNASRDQKGRLLVGAAVGINSDFLGEAEELLKADTDVILVDTARGNSERMVSAIRAIREKFGNELPIAAGNVATAEGTLKLIEAGSDCVKVGIGPGAACVTRLMTGVGVPQLTAIAQCSAVASKFYIPVIGDGGIRYPGDLVKALAAGADTVMIGRLLSATEETPGSVITKGDKRLKVYRGSASYESQLIRSDWSDEDREKNFRVPEGELVEVEYRGEAAPIINKLIGGLRSAMSYVGTWTLEEFRMKARFVTQTRAGFEEGKSHDI
ncbi:MAG: IMP dehydrogenase [Candidatus Nealsonbacteria bacterium]|nr:IMP dehydrogenase [Candidatus Nealsonbacteria bacterium]